MHFLLSSACLICHITSCQAACLVCLYCLKAHECLSASCLSGFLFWHSLRSVATRKLSLWFSHISNAKVLYACMSTYTCTSALKRCLLASCVIHYLALPYREEVFGPVFTVLKFRTDADAIALANDCAFGLGSTVFSRSKARANKIAHQLQVGCFCTPCYNR